MKEVTKEIEIYGDVVTEMECLSYLINNYEALGGILSQSEEGRKLHQELRNIAARYQIRMTEYQQALVAKGGTPPKELQLFLVGTRSRLPKVLVTNYIYRAIRNHSKFDYQKPFEGVPTRPEFMLRELTNEDINSALKQTVREIADIKENLTPFFEVVQ